MSRYVSSRIAPSSQVSSLRLTGSRVVHFKWFALGSSGWAFAGLIWIVGWGSGVFRLSGDVRDIFFPAGRAMLAGANPYAAGVTPPDVPFLYAPPWATVFGLVAPAGPVVVHAALIVAELIALRYIAGSWVRAGAFCWFPLVPWEIAAGQMNLLSAAAIVAAVRGRPEAAAVLGMAKVSPVLAVHPRDWRRFLLAAGLFALLSLPNPSAWVWWIERLAATLATPLGPLVPLPFLVRLPVGLALVAWGRPWSRALGAVVATPGLYWGALVLLVAPLGFTGMAIEGRVTTTPGRRPVVERYD